VITSFAGRDYASAGGVPIEPPILIEDIVEKHLKIGIEFDAQPGSSPPRFFGIML